ncbi:MAG: helicase-associated domain-containing protein [Bellilinea sp.]
MPLPDLLHSLHGRDLGFLKIIAGLWRIELDVPNVRAALPMLTRAMLDPELANEIIGALPIAAQDALIALAEQDGLLSWAQFTRNYGDVRSMGAARRDRERPDLNPRTPAELLWYYGLIGQAFLDMPPEPQQYAYIPGDLLALLKIPERRMTNVLGRPASPDETGYPIFVTDRVLDHACTLLAALRLQLPLDRIPSTQWTIPLPNLRALLFATGLLDANDMPLPEPVRHFLEAPRAQALAQLASAWLRSSTYNEMRLLPGLVFEGDWLNDALQARTRVLEHLRRLPQDSWWSLAAFTSAIRERDPDFQRPAGDYDSWFIRRAGTDQYLRGFSAWDEVDGEVVRSLICGPLHWLGFLDLAAPGPDAPAAAFRPSTWAAALWKEQPPSGLADEDGQVNVHSDGQLDVPRLAPRAVRYQLARFADWSGEDDGTYHYRITPVSLERAHQQGLRVTQLVSLLKKHAGAPLAPALIHALERWEQHGTEASLEKIQLLRVSRPEILAALRNVRASRFLGEEISPTVVVLRPGGAAAILQALAELGYLGESRLGTDV